MSATALRLTTELSDPWLYLPVDDRVSNAVYEAVEQMMSDIAMDDVTSRLAMMTDAVDFRTFCRQEVQKAPLPFPGAAQAAQRYADFLCLLLLGVEADKVSALYMLHYFKSCGGFLSMLPRPEFPGSGPQQERSGRLTLGMAYLVGCLAAKVHPCPIILGRNVTSITQHGSLNICTVGTSAGTFHTSRKVIISIPTSSYKHITFTPQLPPRKQGISRNATMGYCCTIVLTYAQQWWRYHGHSGVFHAERGPITFTQNSSVPGINKYTITCFLVGERGRAWSQLPREQRYHAILTQIKDMYQDYYTDRVPLPIHWVVQDWSRVPGVGGGFMAVIGPRKLTPDGSELATPHGSIHFVGAETVTEWRGHMEGAVRSGKRGAREVLRALGRVVQDD